MGRRAASGWQGMSPKLRQYLRGLSARATQGRGEAGSVERVIRLEAKDLPQVIIVPTIVANPNPWREFDFVREFSIVGCQVGQNALEILELKHERNRVQPFQ
jgi:hypothetical protein